MSNEHQGPEMSSIVMSQLDEIWGRKDPLVKKRKEIKRWGERIIFIAGDILRDIPQFKFAAIESRLPQNLPRPRQDGVRFSTEGLDVHVNFFEDGPKRTRRMLLEVERDLVVRKLIVSTYLGQTDDPDKRIHFSLLDRNDLEFDSFGIRAAREGINMLKAIKEAARVNKFMR